MSTIASQLFRPVVPGIVLALVTGGLVLDLLLENAVEYAETSTVVDVSLERMPDASSRRLVVANTTRELMPDDPPLMFERLWRRDAARSSQRHGGPGLSLAKACARQLGVGIRPSLDVGGRLVMALSGIAVRPSEAFARAIVRRRPRRHARCSLAPPAGSAAKSPLEFHDRAQRSARLSVPFARVALGTT